jgi:hypothetical protein
MIGNRCFPLNTAVKASKPIEDVSTGYIGFTKVLAVMSRSIVGKESTHDVEFDYDYDNLFYHRFERRKILSDLSGTKQYLCILRNTYFARRLKANTRLMLRKLLESDGLLKLKEILHVADGVIMSLILGLPEVLIDLDEPYSVTDRISNSIISNCLFNYDKVVKEIKRFKKIVKHACFSRIKIVEEQFMKDHHWMLMIIRYLNKDYEGSSKSRIFRVAMLTQTRATGLGGKTMMEESFNKFRENASIKQSFTPNDTLKKAIDMVTSECVLGYTPTTHNFRTSVSTSAAVESPKSKEGKFGFLKTLVEQGDLDIDDFEFLVKHDLESSTGFMLWNLAKDKIDSDPESVRRMNAAGVREPGKIRLVGSGSFYKDVYLQPFSHLLIDVCKTLEELHLSFKARRLGYEFLKTAEMHGRGFENGGGILYSSDWSEATDTPSHEKGYYVMARLLVKCGFSFDDIETVFKVWSNDRPVFRNGKYSFTLVNGQPMGDPLTKVDLSLTHPIATQYAKLKYAERFHEPITVFANGNGDDDILAICSNPDRADIFNSFRNEAIVMLGYKISELDTFKGIWGTYCEEIFRLPRYRGESVQKAASYKMSEVNPYLDYPKLRLLLDVKKDRVDFSSDPKGKITLLGKDAEYVRKEQSNHMYDIYRIAMAMQDVCLGTKYIRHPIYLHSNILGLGRAPTWKPSEYLRAINSQVKQFARDATIEIMNEYITERFDIMRLKTSILRDQPHFSKEFLLETVRLPEDYILNKYKLIDENQWDLFPVGVIEKLLSVGELISSREVIRFYLFQKRISELEQTQEADLFSVIREQKEIPSRSEEEKLNIVTKFCGKFSSRPYALRYFAKEAVYHKDVLKIMDKYDPFRVNLDNEPEIIRRRTNHLTPLQRLTPWLRNRRPDSSPINQLSEWFYQEIDRILTGEQPLDPVPQFVVDDDKIIINNIIEDDEYPIHVIVTDDIKLVNFASDLALPLEKLVLRISVLDFLITLPHLGYNSHDVAEVEYWTKMIDERGSVRNTPIFQSALDDALNAYIDDGVYDFIEDNLGDKVSKFRVHIDTGSVEKFSPTIRVNDHFIDWTQNVHEVNPHDFMRNTRIINKKPEPYSDYKEILQKPNRFKHYMIGSLIAKYY